MKKKTIWMSALLCVLLTFLLGSQGMAAARISKANMSLYVGQSSTLKMVGTSKKVKWSSNNKAVATVSGKGRVTAKKAGTALIKARIKGKTATCRVTVKKPSIKLNKTKAAIYTTGSRSVQLKATVKGPGKKVTWKSSNKSVATVNSKGKVTAKKAGTATITAKANGVTAKCKITVKKKTVKFKSLEGKSYDYENLEFQYGISVSNGQIYLGIWEASRPGSSSVEDFSFRYKEGKYKYTLKGMRSGYYYDVTIKPGKNSATVSIKCQNPYYRYFDIPKRVFR